MWLSRHSVALRAAWSDSAFGSELACAHAGARAGAGAARAIAAPAQASAYESFLAADNELPPLIDPSSRLIGGPPPRLELLLTAARHDGAWRSLVSAPALGAGGRR